MNIENFVTACVENGLGKKHSGIYGLYCQANKKLYIGQSGFIRKRLDHHRKHLENNKHVNDKLQFTWNKYGADSFVFFVVEHCGIDLLYEREAYFVGLFDKENLLNLSPVFNPDREDLPPSFIDENWRNKISNSLKGRKLTDSHKNKMSICLRRRTLKYDLVLFDKLFVKIKRDNRLIFIDNKWIKYEQIVGFNEGQNLVINLLESECGNSVFTSKEKIKKIFLKGEEICVKEDRIVLDQNETRLYIDL